MESYQKRLSHEDS